MNGEGSIYRRKSDGRWVAALSVGSRDERIVHTRYARTKAEARAALDQLKVGQTITSTDRLGDYLERWVNEARDIKDTTRRGYRVVVNFHLQPTIGHIRLVDLTPLDVEAALTTLKPTMSAKSLRNVHSVLRRALQHAVRMDLVSRNVASRDYIETPKVPDTDPEAFTLAEERALIAASMGDDIEAAVIVALGTGLRQGELLGLAWEDIEPTRLHVRKELVYLGNGAYDRLEPKTPRSKRTVPLAPHVAAAIERHRQRLIAKGFIPTATGPVFVNQSGAELSGSWVTHRLYKLEAIAGVRRLPFKNLRTTFASRLYDLGVPDLTIAALMGHTRTHTTKRHYISTTPEQAVEAVARLVG
jgi:integrase